jgi:Cu/Ag efflux pump CusA
VTVQVDRERMARLGVTMQAVDDVLYDAFGQRQISTIYTDRNYYQLAVFTGHENEAADAFAAAGHAGPQVPLADEIGDVLICLDKIAACYGINLADAAASKFNKTSREHGFTYFLPEGQV